MKLKFSKTKALTLCSLVLVPGAVVLGCWGTNKAIKKIDANERDFVYAKRKTPNKFEKYCVAVPYYIPSAIVTGLAMAAIINNDRLNNSLMAATLGASTVTAKAFRDYKDAVERIDEDVAEQANFERIKRDGEVKTSEHRTADLKPSSDELLYFRDEFGTEWYATERDMIDAYARYNRLFQQNQGVPLSDYYICCGLRPSSEMTEYSDSVGYFDETIATRLGWCMDYFIEGGFTILWIDIWYDEIERENGEKGYLISYDIEPITNWKDYEWE